MTQEEKDLLLKDICARLPYSVKCTYYDKCIDEEEQGTLTGMQNGSYFVIDGVCIDVENVKPYLYPLSSMTVEQKKEFIQYAGYEAREEENGYHYETYYYDLVGHENVMYPDCAGFDWLNKNNFDYRGLIPMGLAVDCTNLKIY